MREPDWSVYARQYDVMAEINPAYQELVAHCVKTVLGWQLCDGHVIADLGAGTGNFSIALSLALPSVTVLHVELNEQMLALAESKARQACIRNWRAVRFDLKLDAWPIPKLAGVVAVHSIYTFKNPRLFIHRLCAQVQEGGFVYACDLGRVMLVYDWACYLFRRSLWSRGALSTLALLARTNLVRRQNKLIAKAQRSGVFWTHDLGQFSSCFEQSGISITEACGAMYRGYDDLIIGQKVTGGTRRS